MKVFHGNAVSAIVAVVDDVQRLMHVADKMDEITDRPAALYRIGRLIFQNGALLYNRLRHASVLAAVFVGRAFMLSARNVDVMPRPIVPLVADVIWPRGSIHQHVRSGVAAITLQLGINGVFAE